MEQDVDIVIPWLNPTEKWFSEYKKYCENENPARIRDLNTMRPVLNSIFKNLSWIRYIWLIVYDEEQIPDWDELKNEKVKIVYHRDIIPQEFLPNFNSMITECFVSKIEGLAENFIWANDDMVFVKPVPKEYYFKNNKSVHRIPNLRLWSDNYTNTFAKICNNTARFIASFNDGKKFWASDYHMPIPVKKSLAEFILTKYNSFVMNSCKNSKIRKEYNIVFMQIIFTLEEVHKLCVYDRLQDIKFSVIHFDDTITKQKIQNMINTNHIVCLNDSEGLVKKADDVAQYIKELL